MTRINVVPVEELTDNFILAEYYELPRLFVNINAAIDRHEDPNDPRNPTEYKLGKGHMRFFYNKVTYLKNRHRQLHQEGTKRGLNLKTDPDTHSKTWVRAESNSAWFNDYEPTPEAIQLNRDRLQYRRKYEGGSYSTTGAF